MPGTKLTNVMADHMLYLGNKLQELAYVYNSSRLISDYNFMKNVSQAIQDSIIINNASMSINQSLSNTIAFNDTYMPAALIILFAAFVVLSIGFLISIVSFSCVTATQERKYKWFGNLSWCTSSLSLIMIFTASLFLSYQGP